MKFNADTDPRPSNGGDIRNKSPFRSMYFLVGSVLVLSALATNVYIIFRHWEILGVSGSLFISAFVGIQALNQWRLALRYRSKLRSLCSEEPPSEFVQKPTPILILQIAEQGLYDLMLFSGGMALFALLIIGGLLTHLDGLR